VRVDPAPGARYSTQDEETETHYCSIELYRSDIALCPKSWSTSPGTILYNLQTIPFSGTSAEFERTACSEQKKYKKLLKYKQTMNEVDTSGTYSTSSLVYYHLSRFLDATIHVPVSVYREMDRQAHLERVTESGISMGLSGMIGAGWKHLYDAESRESNYSPLEHLFTRDRQKIYGIFISGVGERYGPEINGIRSAWGVPQNLDFQETPAFRALRSELPFRNAIRQVLNSYGAYLTTAPNTSATKALLESLAKTYPKMNVPQMVYWMKELSEIAVLDFVLTQQDRIGNIDYEWVWYWREGNQLRSQTVGSDLPLDRKSEVPMPPGLSAKSPLLLQRSHLNDNDAGTYTRYANYTKKTEMLEKIRHLAPATYVRLKELAMDFRKKGRLYRYFEGKFGLSPGDLAGLVRNTELAFGILQNQCRKGSIRFDLDPEATLLEELGASSTAQQSSQPLGC